MTTSGKTRQVIHLHLLISDEHYYYGSILAMYEHFNRKQLGVSAQTLYNTWKNEPYITNLAVIRKGRLIQKKQKNVHLEAPKSETENPK